MTSVDLLVVGRGIIGALAAWRASRAGLSVASLDPDPGNGATFAAAGMIAPVTEAEFNERDLAALNVASARSWPAFAAEVEGESGLDIGYRPTGVVHVAFDRDDARLLARLGDLQRSFGLSVAEVTVDEARRREPLLGPRIAAAAWTPQDAQVDPRRLVAALEQIMADRGVTRVNRGAERLVFDGSRVVGVIDSAGEEHRADTVLVAAGSATGPVVSAVAGLRTALRGVKGEILRLDASQAPWLREERIVRGFVQGRPVYIVTRPDGEIVVGATSDERADDRRVTAGGVFALLRDARTLLPGLDETTLVDHTARVRPTTPDNAPVFGDTGVPGLMVASGHYRHGILLAAATSSGFDALLAGRDLDETWAVARPNRFIVKEST